MAQSRGSAPSEVRRLAAPLRGKWQTRHPVRSHLASPHLHALTTFRLPGLRRLRRSPRGRFRRAARGRLSHGHRRLFRERRRRRAADGVAAAQRFRAHLPVRLSAQYNATIRGFTFWPQVPVRNKADGRVHRPRISAWRRPGLATKDSENLAGRFEDVDGRELGRCIRLKHDPKNRKPVFGRDHAR